MKSKQIIKTNITERSSNLELLRMLSMFLVLVLHYVVNIKVDQTTVLSKPIYSLLTIELKSLSVVCVNCFILISGYFGIKWKVKSFVGLIFQVLFWLILGLLIARSMNFSYSGNILSVLYTFFNSRWFIPAYLCLYILSPMINAYIEKASDRSLLFFIIVFYSYSIIVGWLLSSDEFNKGMSSISLIGLYLIGALINKSDLKIFKYSALTNLSIYLLLSMVLSLIYFGMLGIGISISIHGYLNPLIIFMSIYLFLFFQKLKIGKIKWLNYLAVSVLAVYLFHQHPAIDTEFYKYCKIIRDTGSMSFLWCPLFLIGIFISCIIVDKFRILIFNSFYNNWNKIRTFSFKGFFISTKD